MTNRRSILLLMISIVFATAEEFLSDDAFPDKRSSMALPGDHGKKNLAPWDHHDELSKRAPMGFQGMRGKKSSIMAEVDGELFPDETKKRAPMGFQGMRGKKNNLLMTDYGDTYLHDGYGKRAPMGFQGMRGKKSLREIFDELNKRAVANRDDAAIGDTYLLDYPDDSDKRSSPMDTYESIRDKKIRYLREWEKKAPMGFQGMRGKKMILDALEELNKGSIMDLQGRKDTFDNYLEYPINPFDYEKWNADLQGTGNPGESFKRDRMAFHGTRSKRDAADAYRYNPSYARTGMGYQGTSNRGNNPAAYEIEKRSPFGYISVRGKKNPRWEFRGKFVGVRGKKSSVPQAARQGQPVF